MGVAQERARRFNGLGYEVRFFAHKHRLTLDTAREIINQVGPDRAKLDNEAAAHRERLGRNDSLALENNEIT